jgi:hypothetical protein
VDVEEVSDEAADWSLEAVESVVDFFFFDFFVVVDESVVD